MRANVHVEIWDDTPAQKMDEIGITTKFVKTCYQVAFEQLLKEMCSETQGVNYTVSVDVTAE